MRKMFINLCEPISAVEKSPYSGMQFILKLLNAINVNKFINVYKVVLKWCHYLLKSAEINKHFQS